MPLKEKHGPGVCKICRQPFEKLSPAQGVCGAACKAVNKREEARRQYRAKKARAK